ncbi:hypothetical protein KQ298_08965 [Synechococcus sp. CS-1330]|nr:hypothetical protein [Synechococcus sp. CS-1330]
MSSARHQLVDATCGKGFAELVDAPGSGDHATRPDTPACAPRKDREGHISAQPHYMPRKQALIPAANQQRVLCPQPEVRVL